MLQKKLWIVLFNKNLIFLKKKLFYHFLRKFNFIRILFSYLEDDANYLTLSILESFLF